MNINNQIVLLYEEYLAHTMELMDNRTLSDAFTKRLENDPCHNDFIEKLKVQLELCRQEGLTNHEWADVLGFIYRASVTYDSNKLSYWMMIAAHSLTESYIELLDAKDAANLAYQYLEDHPKRNWLPIQKTIYRALVQRGRS